MRNLNQYLFCIFSLYMAVGCGPKFKSAKSMQLSSFSSTVVDQTSLPPTPAQVLPTPTPVPTPAPPPAPVLNPAPMPMPMPIAPSLVSATTRHDVTSPSHQRLYGPGVFLTDNLWNVDIGGSQAKKVSIRFRAVKSGKIISLQPYMVANTTRFGYSAGTGGNIRFTLFQDDETVNHFPKVSEPSLGVGFFKPVLDSQARYVNRRDAYPVVSFSSSQPLVAGRLYHLVLENVDPTPAQNYIGYNASVQIREHGSPGRWTNPLDWALLERKGARSWEDNTVGKFYSDYLAPTLQINMEDGSNFGNSGFEPGNYEYQHAILSNSRATQKTDTVVERFSPKANHSITGLSILMGATSPGTVHFVIREGTKILAEGSFSESQSSYLTSTRTSQGPFGQFKWYDQAFKNPVQFLAGRIYDVEFKVKDSSEWRFAAQRNGADYGFKFPSAFTESEAWYEYDGKMIRKYAWTAGRDYGFSNWRVVLHKGGI